MLPAKQKEILLVAAKKVSNADVADKIILTRFEKPLSEIQLANDPHIEGERDMIDIVTQWRIMVGQSKDQTPTQLEVEARFMKNNYGNLTIADLDLAMELFLNNRLDIDLPTSVFFSPLFISHIMNAYKRYKEVTISHVNKIADPQLLMLEYSQEGDRLEGLKDCIQQCAMHAQGGFAERFFNGMVYDFLTRTRRLIVDPNTAEQAREYASKKYVKDRQANREREKSKTDAKLIGDSITINPAAMYPDRRQAEYYYFCDWWLMDYFEGTNLGAMLDTIKQSELPKTQK